MTVATTPAIDAALMRHAPVAIGVSGGKDSDAAAIANRRFEPTANFDQQLVANGMAERIVDQLEAVEIDQQQRTFMLAVPLPHRCLFNQLAHQQAIGEPGQGIGAGSAHRIVA